jgi:hypothetical protein
MGDVSLLRNEKANTGSEAQMISPAPEHRLVQAVHARI